MAESVRLQKNQDLLDRGVWIRHADTGVTHLVFHKAHVRRMLDDGGVQVAGPESDTPVAVEAQAATIADLQAQLAALQARLAQEEAHGIDSTPDHGAADRPREVAHSGPSGGKSAVRR